MMLEEELEAMGIHVDRPGQQSEIGHPSGGNADLDGALLDLNINGAYATEVAEKLRLRAIPFVFVTGYEPPRRPALSRGAGVAVSRSPRSSCARRCCHLWDK